MADISMALRVILHTLQQCRSEEGGRGRGAVSDFRSIFPARLSRVSDGLRVLPYLHPFSTGAHVLAQEEAVQVTDQEEELLHCLPHDLRSRPFWHMVLQKQLSCCRTEADLCRHPCHLCWRTAPSLWVSGQKCPADSRIPACPALQREMEAFPCTCSGIQTLPLLSCIYSRSRTMFTRAGGYSCNRDSRRMEGWVGKNTGGSGWE